MNLSVRGKLSPFLIFGFNDPKDTSGRPAFIGLAETE